MSAAAFARGDRVRILTGMAGGRVGVVLSARPGYRGLVVNVEVEIPVLLTDPDGLTQVVQMPYAPDELEAVERKPASALADGPASDAAATASSSGPGVGAAS